MEILGIVGFGIALAAAAWLIVRFIKRLQDTSDRRYPENTDDGRLGSGS